MSKEVGNRIRNTRKSLGMSQEELSNMAGYTNRSTIARIENGEIDLPISKMKELASALKVAPAYLMGLEDMDGNDLTGNADFKYKEIVSILDNMSQEGVEKVLAYAQDLNAAGIYKKCNSVAVGEK